MDILKLLCVSQAGSLAGLAVFVVILVAVSRLPKKKFSFAVRVLMGTGAGTVYGLILWALSGGSSPGLPGPFDPAAIAPSLAGDVGSWAWMVGRGYLLLLACLVPPMVFLASAQLVIHTPAEKQVSPLTRWKKRVNTLMVAISAAIGVCLALGFQVGLLPGTERAVFSWEGEANLRDLLFQLVPKGAGVDLVARNVVGLFVFGIFVGMGTRRMSAKMEAVRSASVCLDGIFNIGVSVCKTVIAYKPIGVAAVMTGMTALYGPAIVLMILKMLAVLCLGAALMLAVQLLFCACSGVGPAAFFRAGKTAMIKAVKTRSGSDCLPEAQQALSEGLGLRKEITDEVSSYAISSGMQGCAALFPATAAIYALGLGGVVMTPGTVLVLILIIVLMSYGITGLPGTATMAEFAAVMGTGAAGSMDGLGAMVAIDPIGDVPRTLINVTGCMANAIIVERRVRE